MTGFVVQGHTHNYFIQKFLLCVFLYTHKSILIASYKYGWTTDVRWTIPSGALRAG